MNEVQSMWNGNDSIIDPLFSFFSINLKIPWISNRDWVISGRWKKLTSQNSEFCFLFVCLPRSNHKLRCCLYSLFLEHHCSPPVICSYHSPLTGSLYSQTPNSVLSIMSWHILSHLATFYLVLILYFNSVKQFQRYWLCSARHCSLWG